ncbi:MAG: hypothetical protein JXL97_00065 [Bacteroidales bacterium]|nr:hypothetical protein [Bacteroidales bacterium]
MLDKLRKFLATQGKVRIIEAIVDPDLQVEYLEFASKVRKDIDEEEVIENSDKIFDSEVDIEEKKRLIVLMASIDDVNLYRKLEKYIDLAEDELKSWVLIAHQECQTVIQSSLLEENQILVSTGLGGKGQKMRFFIVLQVDPKQEITESQREIIRKEINYAFSKFNCDIENIEFKEFFCTLVGLFPFEVEIEDVFNDIILESNNLGVNLTDKFIVTNVRIHTLDETEDLIRELDEKAKQEKEGELDDDFGFDDDELEDFLNDDIFSPENENFDDDDDDDDDYDDEEDDEDENYDDDDFDEDDIF